MELDERLEVLFEVHQKIGEEIGMAEIQFSDEGREWHINGLKEANNRVEQVMYDIIEEEKPL